MASGDRIKGSPEGLLRGFIDKFDPENRDLIRAVRKALRKRFSTAYELAYDNYNFFVLGYSPTERPSDAVRRFPIRRGSYWGLGARPASSGSRLSRC